MTTDPPGENPLDTALAAAWHVFERVRWPYPELEERCPRCPECGGRPQALIGANLHPMYFCADDACRRFSWDPTQPAAQNIAESKNVDITGEEPKNDR